jgi:predicted HTH domain antitoxin
MKTIKVNIPDTSDLEELEVIMAAASKLFEKGRISSGQAAEMVGVSKRTFLEMLSAYGVSIFKLDESELDIDIKNAKNHHR